MNAKDESIRDFVSHAGTLIGVEIVAAKGSTPRENGAIMLVSREAIFGTIGGGQLEFLAITHARKMLDSGQINESLEIPLGPDISQCCGGHVRLLLERLDEGMAERICGRSEKAKAHRPHVYLFGAGHVGHALARALSLLPVRTRIVDTRPETLEDFGSNVETILAAMPEAIVREAPPHSAFVVLTHDHALDFMITAEILGRGDAAYTGLIGSKTKKTVFRKWYFANGGSPERFAKLVSPIGGSTVRDKRPVVIAALTTAEIVTALASVGAGTTSPAPILRELPADNGPP